MNIAEWESFALCCRIKSTRSKKRCKRKGQEKELIHYYKRLVKLRKQIAKPVYEDLVPPIQKGWKRFFVLREDVARSDEAEFLQQLVDKVNAANGSTKYSMRRDFKVKRKQKGRKVYVPTEQPFPVFIPYFFSRLGLTEAEAACFKKELRWYNCGWKMVYVFQEAWKFGLRVKPHFITQVRKIDPLLIQEEREIENYLGGKRLIKVMVIMNGGGRNYRNNYKGHDRMKYRSLFKTESVSTLEAEWLNEQNEENEQ